MESRKWCKSASRGKAAINRQVHAGDVAGIFTSQKSDGGGNLGCLGNAAQREALDPVGQDCERSSGDAPPVGAPLMAPASMKGIGTVGVAPVKSGIAR